MTLFQALKAAAGRIGKAVVTLGAALYGDSVSDGRLAGDGGEDDETVFQEGPARARAESKPREAQQAPDDGEEERFPGAKTP